MRFQRLQGVILGVAIGLSAGIGGFTFVYARGASYLTNESAACANCHVMRPYFDAWLKSSHRAVAACNDCHTPHGFVRKCLVKAWNGFRHSLAFTTGHFPDSLHIKPYNHDVVEEACRRCHEEIVQAIEGPDGTGPALSCVRCHDSVGHLR